MKPGNAERAAGPFAGRTLIIINPAAGQEDPARLRRLIGGAFAARRAPFDLVETTHAGHAVELSREAAGLGYRAVCVVGGDGTLAEAATGLAGTDTPLALIPRGTANQVAHNLRIPTNLEEAVDVAINGEAAPVDLGRIGDRVFALVAGAGFDAAVMASATRGMKERWGFGAYVFAAVKEALTAQPVDFRITADGVTMEVRAVSVMLANVGELFAHFLPFALPLAPRPGRSWQDGLFDVVVLAPRNVIDVPNVLWKAMGRNYQSDDDRLLHFQAREVTIEADPPIAVQIDGDPAGVTPVSARAVERGVHIIAPALT
ncbi:MAG TPA: diacylglycerol kinase family protein [Longimicrobiales bacterium]|nr:diacylglycerol kinase family protein [Longimicrobiales bacterium]